MGKSLTEFLTDVSKLSESGTSTLVSQISRLPVADHALWVKRDMFGDSSFPHCIVPTTLEDLQAFLVHATRGGVGDTIKVAKHLAGYLVTITRIKDGKEWVMGFLKRGDLPWEGALWLYHLTDVDLAQVSEYEELEVRKQNKRSREDHGVNLWRRRD